jgi:hypothetical protein
MEDFSAAQVVPFNRLRRWGIEFRRSILELGFGSEDNEGGYLPGVDLVR